tara:strand:+ start:146 stop:409 length:264 start_codon:yes stop_codon:yes gene_type:complete
MDNTLEKNLELRKALAEVDRLTAKIVHTESYIEKEIKSIEKDTEWLIDNLNGGNPIDHSDTPSWLMSDIYKNNEQIKQYQEILKIIK